MVVKGFFGRGWVGGSVLWERMGGWECTLGEDGWVVVYSGRG